MNVERSCAASGRRAAALKAAGLAALLVAASAGAAAGALRPVAVFDFALVDTSLEGEVEGTSPAEVDRLRRISDLLRERLAASPRYRLVDTAPAAAAIARAGDLHACRGCEVEIAAGLGAELALVGWVQKVSNLILNINVSLREVATGRLVQGASVDIRGNTDEAWARGVDYLVRNRLVAD